MHIEHIYFEFRPRQVHKNTISKHKYRNKIKNQTIKDTLVKSELSLTINSQINRT